jgi:hypothetical protein
MGLYYKKRIPVEAVQFCKEGDHPAVIVNDIVGYQINTLEGPHIVTPGDWIIRGVQGEHWAIKHDIFVQTYELVGDEPSNPWKDTMIDTAVVNWSYRKEHETDPLKCLADIINWEIHMALDPAISSDAQALIDRGIEEGKKLAKKDETQKA